MGKDNLEQPHYEWSHCLYTEGLPKAEVEAFLD